jgi:hypothetical protein
MILVVWVTVNSYGGSVLKMVEISLTISYV